MGGFPLASAASARAFVDSLDLAGARVAGLVRSATTEAAPTPSVATPAAGSNAVGLGVKSGVEQAFLVGGQIVSFNAAVTEERRAAALNCCLLAQLRATKLLGTPKTPGDALDWHASIVNTLINLGWAPQADVKVDDATATKGLEVDKILFDIIASLLGDGSVAAVLVKKVLDAITKAKTDDPFITLYNSRVVQQTLVDFGAALGDASDDGFLLSVVECIVEVTSNQQQVLFFKWQSDSAQVTGRRFDLSLSDSVYKTVQPKVEQMLQQHARDFIASISI